MTDGYALQAAIAANPADDTVRLAYADFVEENGDPERAEFIRNQVELARVDPNDPTRLPLVVRNVRFLKECGARWRAELPQLAGITWGDFWRGLVEEVQAESPAAIVQHAAAIFSQPAIHVVRLARLWGSHELATIPELARVRILRTIGAQTPYEVLMQLFVSRHLGNLTVLDLHGNRAGDAGAVTLAATPLPALTELWLGANGIGNAGARALAESPQLQRLQLLDLSANPITDPGIRAALVSRFKSGVKFR